MRECACVCRSIKTSDIITTPPPHDLPPPPLTLCVLVAESGLSHVRHLDDTARAAVGKQVALVRVELRTRNHLVVAVGGGKRGGGIQ